MAKGELSLKEYIILTLLIANGEMFGLDLTEKSEGHIKLGTVYTTLHRMEDKRLVTSREEQGINTETRIPRRLYKTTGEGEKVWKLERERFTSVMHFLEGLV